MLKRLSLALSTALCVSLISPAAASVELIPSSKSIAAGVPAKLAYLVEATGVPVYDGRNLPNLCGGRVLGFYHVVHNAIVMCVQNIVSPELYVEVFAHEAVHLAQDCRDGIENSTLYSGTEEYTASLWTALPEFKQDNILDSYPAEVYAAEIEAFYFEDYPDKVAQGVVDSCF